MTVIQAIILGLVQGITEFLPVSSSGHLIIFQHLLGFEEPPVLFDVLVHLATLVVVLVYFRKRLVKINLRVIKLLCIGTIPTVIAGLFLEPYIEVLFSSLWFVTAGLLITAALLVGGHRIKKVHTSLKKLTYKHAFVIGLFQAQAIFPGISRSGSTVSGAFLNGLKKTDAFYFSFLLAVPAILGAAILQLKDVTSFEQVFSVANSVGFVTAALSGLVALKLLDLVIHKAKLHYFAIYCLLLSLGIIIYQVI